MKKASLLLSTLMALVMVGCVDVPEDVKSRADAVHEESEAPQGELRYIAPAELEADLETAFADIRTPFNVQNGVGFHVPEKVYDLSFETWKGRTDYDSALRYLFEAYDPSKVISAPDMFGEGIVYEDKESSEYAGFSEGGLCVFRKGELYDDLNGSVIKDVLFIDTDDAAEEFEFNGKLTNAKEMADKASDWLAGFDWLNAEGFSYAPSHVFLLENGGRNFLSIRYNRYYEGVMLSSNERETTPGNLGKHHTMTRNFNMNIYVDSQGEVGGMSMGGNLVGCTYAEKTEVEKLVSPSSAFELLEKEFSTRLDLELISVRLKYLTTYDFFCATEDDIFVDVGTPTSARLVWEFLIKPAYPEFGNGVRSIPGFYYINVDALTGEIAFELGDGGNGTIGY